MKTKVSVSIFCVKAESDIRRGEAAYTASVLRCLMQQITAINKYKNIDQKIQQPHSFNSAINISILRAALSSRPICCLPQSQPNFLKKYCADKQKWLINSLFDVNFTNKLEYYNVFTEKENRIKSFLKRTYKIFYLTRIAILWLSF